MVLPGGEVGGGEEEKGGEDVGEVEGSRAQHQPAQQV